MFAVDDLSVAAAALLTDSQPRRSYARVARQGPGLEVATSLLMQPERGVAVRELARELGRSASTVSEVLAALRRDCLVDTKNAVADTQLFWQVADRWKASRTYLTQVPRPVTQASPSRCVSASMMSRTRQGGH